MLWACCEPALWRGPACFQTTSGTVRSATWKNMIRFKLLIFSLKANLRVLLCSPELFYFLFNGLTSIYCRSLVQLLMWLFLKWYFCCFAKAIFLWILPSRRKRWKGFRLGPFVVPFNFLPSFFVFHQNQCIWLIILDCWWCCS